MFLGEGSYIVDNSMQKKGVCSFPDWNTIIQGKLNVVLWNEVKIDNSVTHVFGQHLKTRLSVSTYNLRHTMLSNHSLKLMFCNDSEVRLLPTETDA